MGTQTVDVAVLGAGPSGLALALACAERGLRVQCVAPDVNAPWPNNYGVWADEVEALPWGPGGLLDVPLSPRWTRTQIETDQGPPLLLPRAYGRIDRAAFKALLVERFLRAGGELRAGRVVRVASEGGGFSAELEPHETLSARVVVDATGPASPFLHRQKGGSGAQQVAYGCLFHIHDSPYDPDTVVLMDWRSRCFGGTLRAEEAPSFLYVMPLQDGTVFLQETSLLADPPLPMSLLQERLTARMAAMGLKAQPAGFIERCFIPMNPPLPVLPQPILGFGVAAGMVHPATGYQVAQALRMAPTVAEALARGLDQGGGGPAQAVVDAWGVIWSPARLRARRLYTLGAELTRTLSSAEIAAFFEAFFRLQPERWKAYLSGEASASTVMMSMASMFPSLPWSLRQRAVLHSLTYALRRNSAGSLPPREPDHAN